jgi:hypothetical protein
VVTKKLVVVYFHPILGAKAAQNRVKIYNSFCRNINGECFLTLDTADVENQKQEQYKVQNLAISSLR